jgi:putative redox protein
MTNVNVRLDEGFKTLIQTRGLTVISDEPAAEGGADLGPTPKELMLGALGACAAITAKMYAQRKGWPLEGVEIDLDLERFKTAEYPGYSGTADMLNEFRQRIVFKGSLTQQQRDRLLEIAGKCPVHRILTEPNVVLHELIVEDTLLEQP